MLLARYEHHLRQTEIFVTRIATARDRLNNLYTNLPSKLSASEATKSRSQKEAILNEFRLIQTSLPLAGTNTSAFTKWIQQDLNNALLNTVDTYHRLVPMFHRHLVTNADGDLPSFYRDMKQLGKRTKAQRRAFLATGMTSAGESALRQTSPEPSGARPATRE